MTGLDDLIGHEFGGSDDDESEEERSVQLTEEESEFLAEDGFSNGKSGMIEHIRIKHNQQQQKEGIGEQEEEEKEEEQSKTRDTYDTGHTPMNDADLEEMDNDSKESKNSVLLTENSQEIENDNENITCKTQHMEPTLPAEAAHVSHMPWNDKTNKNSDELAAATPQTNIITTQNPMTVKQFIVEYEKGTSLIPYFKRPKFNTFYNKRFGYMMYLGENWKEEYEKLRNQDIFHKFRYFELEYNKDKQHQEQEHKKWIAESKAFTFNVDSQGGINPLDILKMCKCSVCKESRNNNNKINNE